MRKITKNNINLSENEKEVFVKLGINTKSNRFKRYYEKGHLETVNVEYAENVITYFKKYYHKEIEPICHIAFSNITGIEDVRVIPREIFRSELIPFLNDRGMHDAYADKNSYDILFKDFRQAYTVIKRTRGHYYTNSTELINKDDVERIILKDSKEYILKGSDTANGFGIKKIKIENNLMWLDGTSVTIDEIEQLYGYNFLVQRVIKQHPIMAKLHPKSVNTLRMVTLRWNNEIYNVYTFARIGVNNEVKDNAGTGGLVVGVNDNGEFQKYGIIDQEKVFQHPTTKEKISDLDQVPNYDLFLEKVRRMHERIIHHDFISWDIAVGEDGEPIFIEANFSGSSFLNQIALGRPIFGDLTEEVLTHVAENLPKIKKVNVRALSSRPLRKRFKKVKEKYIKAEDELKEIKRKNKKLEQINAELNQEIQGIKNSKLWRYTASFRKE